MERSELTIFNGEGLTEFVERLGFSLMEVGVRLGWKINEDHVTFEFSKAERLENDEKDRS